MQERSDHSWSGNIAFLMGPLAGFLKNRTTIGESIANASNLDSKSTKLSRYPKIDAALIEWFRF